MYTEQLSQISSLRVRLRKYINEFVRPLESEIDRTHVIRDDQWDELRQGALELSLCAYNVPISLGGPGLNLFGQAVVAEELGRTSQALAEFLYYVPESTFIFNDDQIRKYMPLLVQGAKTITIALTEESGGSNLSAISTTAALVDGRWKLNGSKKYITRGDNADYVIVLARTSNTGNPSNDLSAFILEKDCEGFSAREIRAMGWWGESLAELHFYDCHLPEGALIGNVGDGLKILMRGVTGTRLRVAGKCVGLIEDLYSTLIDLGRSRMIGKERILDLNDIRMKLADLNIDYHAARGLLYEAASIGDNANLGFLDPEYRAAVSRAKVFATEAAWRAADFAVQFAGAAGYTEESRIERIYRDVRGYRIGEGTSEILRIDLMKQMLRRP